MNKCATNILYMYTAVEFTCMVRTAGSYGPGTFDFGEQCPSGHSTCSPTAMYESSSCFAPLTALGITRVLNFSLSSGCVAHSHYGFILCFSDA